MANKLCHSAARSVLYRKGFKFTDDVRSILALNNSIDVTKHFFFYLNGFIGKFLQNGYALELPQHQWLSPLVYHRTPLG
jgi:hypothetical protein